MQVDMFVVFPDSTWTIAKVDIPDDTPKEKIEEVANKILLDDFEKKGIKVEFISIKKPNENKKMKPMLFPIDVSEVTKLGQHAIRYLTLIVMVYVFGTMLFLIYTKKGEFIDQIFTWSVVGFWSFFFGYFGTIVAQEVLETVIKRKK